MSSKQWILKNIRKEILTNKTQSIIEVEFNNLVANAQKSRTIESLSQLKNIVSNESIEQTKLVLNEMRFDDQ